MVSDSLLGTEIVKCLNFGGNQREKRSSKNFVIPVICSFSPRLVFLDGKSESLLAEKFQLNQTLMRNIT